MTAPAPKTPKTKVARKPPPTFKKLTAPERAEAAALWRLGSVTLDDLAKKFKKRPETFGRLFKKMGIAKGSAVAEAEKHVAAVTEKAAVTAVEETIKRIKAIKDSNFHMQHALGRMAYDEVVRARKAGLAISTCRDTLVTLKVAGEIIANSRKELFAVLNVEEHDKNSELEDLPELTVRELTQGEVEQLRSTSTDDSFDTDVGELDLDDEATL